MIMLAYVSSLYFMILIYLLVHWKNNFEMRFGQIDNNITYMATSLIFNTIHTGSTQKYTYLLNLISQHPSFKSKVNQYYEILSCNPTPDSMVKLGTLFFAFLLPEFPDKQLKYLAQELFENIKTHDTQVTYNNLREYLLKMCSYSLENIDVRSAIGFLELLKSRITDTYIVSAVTPTERKKINIDVKIEILQGEAVLNDSGLAEKHHREEVKHIYFEEKVALVQEEVLTIKPTEVLITELKSKIEDVIPWGYICEDFVHNFTNGNFEIKSSYRLRKSKRLNIGKIDYWAASNESTNNLIRDFTVNQQIFITTGVLTHNYLPAEVYPPMAKPLPMARINQTFARKNYLQNLKDTASGTQKFFNIMSEFFQRNEFNIDELSLTREKLIVRRKENLLGIAGKETIKKEQKDFETEVATMGLQISKNLMKFYDETRIQSVTKQLQTNLRQVQEQDKNLNTVIEKNLSFEDHIQRDSGNPFLQDIIKFAKMVPLQLLVLGRPKSGKTTLAKAIAKKYSLVYISVESMIDKIFERSKFFEENPPEVDEDGNAKDGLLPIEKFILSQLQKGVAVDEEDVLDLINNQFEKEFTQSRGFILDLPFEYNKYWIETLIGNRIYLPKIQCRSFTHIIQTDQTEQQWKHFTSSLMEKPEDQTISSGYDRYLLRKPKPPPEEGEEEAEQEEAEKPQPLVEANLLQVKWKDSNFSLIQHFTQHIHPHKFIKVQNSFQSIPECLNLLQNSLYKIPLPKKIEGNEKQLLGVGLEEQKIFRKWSPWGLIDCVQLSKDKLLAGKFQFAAEYAGRVFVFENQINLNSFLNLPRKYLDKLPQLPKNTNIFINGPRKSGKKTIANLLGNLYGLKVINIQEILEKVLSRQRQFEAHVPSNFDKRSSSIHLSQTQFRDFSKGGLLNAKDVLPIILYQLGVTLQKKPVGWGVEKTEEGGNAESPEPEERKAAPKKTKKKDKNAEEERPKTPPPEDLPLKDIIPEINHLGKLNEIRGYIIIGYPNNEEQLNALKQFNIPIDKLIILSDNTEEAPNKNLQKRLTDAELEQVGLFTTAVGPVKQALGEEVCKEILIDKTPDEIVNKIRQIIDPFYLKADEDSLNRVCADKTEEGDPIPMGFCGDYCPVSLKNGWLIKGKQQFQAGIQGKRFKFSGEKELNQFKLDPSKYLPSSVPAIPPRIMFMGLRGVGLKTQLLKLNDKYRIPILSLKDTLLQQLENEKGKRKTERYYNKGFKKPEFDEEGKQLEDPEILEEAADFDRKANEIEVIKNIFNGINEIFINANFFDVEEEKVSTSIVQLLGEARRLPQLVFMLTSDEQKWLDRVLDKKAIERELEDLKEKKRLLKEKEKEEARKKAQQAGEEYNEPPEEEDPDIPKLEELIAQKQEGLKAQREADSAKLQEFTQAFKSWGVEVISIKCEREIKHVTDRINYLVKPIIEDRINRWEKNSMLPIERHRVNDFLNNYIVSESRFGKLNPYTLMENPKPYPLIYKDRIYYLKDEEERDYVIRNPKTLDQNEAIPRDVKFVPIIFIIGKTKSGRSTLALNLKEKYGFKIISIQEIIEQFVKEHEDSDIKAIINEIRTGKCLSDEAVITLIQKRTSLYDCSKGWILDGLPLNKRQCQILNKKAIIPTIVLSVRMSELEIKKKVISKAKQTKNQYDYDLQVIHKRLETTKNSLIEVEIYYNSKYNNVKLVNGNLSKWGVLEQTKNDIEKKVKARRNFIKDLVTHSATDVTHIGLSSNCVLHNLSEYLNFCPISYKIRRQYVKVCIKNYQNIALFNRKIYAFKSEKELKDFIANPDTFVSKGSAFSPPQQINIEDIYNLYSKFENKGYCMIELSKKNLTRGNSLFGLAYKDKYFLTSTAKNQRLFQKNPALYEMVKLPDKLPVEFEKKSDLKKIAKRNDCSAFLEHHLSNIMMKCLAQLGYRRPKYPTLGSKESALKFLSISLKANNPNKDDEYRQKYSEKLNKFIKECNYSQEIREGLQRKAKGQWESHDEQNLLKLCEEYNQFMRELETTDKTQYFSNFIR